MRTRPSPKERWLSRGLVAMLAGLVWAFVVAGGAGVAQAAPILSFDVECTPDTIRPHEEALFTCSTTISNSGDATATDVDMTGTLASGLSIPSFELFDRVVNGEPVFISSGQMTFDFPDLEPGESAQETNRVLFGVRDEGSYGFQLDLRHEGQTIDSVTVSFEALPESPYPPTNLEVTNRLIETLPSPEPLSPPHQLSPPNSLPPGQEHAVYELLIRNVSDTPMSGLTVWDRQSAGALMGANDPSAVSIDDETGVTLWELGGLDPGEETRIQFTLQQAGTSCASSINTAVVTAQTPAEEESYVARADSAVTLGFDCPRGQGGNGRGGPGLSLPGTGTSVGDGSGAAWMWLLAVLVTGGITALGLGAERMRRPQG